MWCICLGNSCTVNVVCVMQQRSQEARQNWESALESKDRALTQLEDALVTQKRTLQQQMDQQQAAVSMTHNQLIQGTDAQIAMQRQLEQSQQQVCSSIWLCFVRTLRCLWHSSNLASHVTTFYTRDTLYNEPHVVSPNTLNGVAHTKYHQKVVIKQHIVICVACSTWDASGFIAGSQSGKCSISSTRPASRAFKRF